MKYHIKSNIYKLSRDGEHVGIFMSQKSLKRYIHNWQESYYNQDEYDSDYIPKWQIEEMECDADD